MSENINYFYLIHLMEEIR